MRLRLALATIVIFAVCLFKGGAMRRKAKELE